MDSGISKVFIAGLFAFALFFSGCATSDDSKEILKSNAQKFCGKENVAKVSVCEDSLNSNSLVKVESSLLGGGSTYYKSDAIYFQCPVVGPDSMSPECRELFNADAGSKFSCTEIC